MTQGCGIIKIRGYKHEANSSNLVRFLLEGQVDRGNCIYVQSLPSLVPVNFPNGRLPAVPTMMVVVWLVNRRKYLGAAVVAGSCNQIESPTESQNLVQVQIFVFELLCCTYIYTVCSLIVAEITHSIM